MSDDQGRVTIERFYEESIEGIDSIDPLVRSLVPNQTDRVKLGNILKVVHCIKGTAALFPFRKLVGITRAVEDLLVNVLEERIWLTGEVIGALVDAMNGSRQILLQIQRDYEEGQEDYMGLIGKLRGLGVRAALPSRPSLDMNTGTGTGAMKSGQATMTVIPISKKTAQRLTLLVGDLRKLEQEFQTTSGPAGQKLQGLVTSLDSEIKTILGYLEPRT